MTPGPHRVGVVTGASRGIGRAVAETLGAAGDRLVLVARSRRSLGEVAAATGGDAFPADVSDPAAAAKLVEHVLNAGGGAPDYVVHCAGTFLLAPLEHTPPAEFERVVRTNLTATFLVVRGLLPALRAAGRGRIVLLGSVAGRRPFPGNAAYSASKYGVRGLFDVLLQEVEGSGVAATLIEPAATDTPLWDGVEGDGLPRREAMLEAAEVAEAVRWVLDRPAHVRVPYLPISRAPG